jgi:hypothetical protein
MIWLFSRRKEEIRLETWYDKHTSEFVVDIVHPHEHTESKRFLNDRVFQTWLMTWGRQLAVEGWMQSGPFLSVPSSTTTRTYATGTHHFEITLSRMLLKQQELWTVALVTDTRRAGKRLSIAGMHAVVSATPDAAFADACDRIDRWLVATSKA